MSSIVKIGFPAAILGALLTLAGYELGQRHTLARLEKPPQRGAGPAAASSSSPGDGSSQAPAVEAMPEPEDLITGLETDCRCPPGRPFSLDAAACVNFNDFEGCEGDIGGQPVKGCDGFYYGSVCSAARLGIKKVEVIQADYASVGLTEDPCHCPQGSRFRNGKCVPKSATSPDPACNPNEKTFKAVCGCDGDVYLDACVAQDAGLKAWSDASSCKPG